jgi:uncharacterized protein (TIGR02996 family)
MMPTRTNGELLLRESLKHPEEESYRLLYADWLDEEAMERGEPLPCPRARFVRMGYHPGWIPLTPTERQFGWLGLEGGAAGFVGTNGSGTTTALLMALLRGATRPTYRALVVAPSHCELSVTGNVGPRLCRWLRGPHWTWKRGRYWVERRGAVVECGSARGWRWANGVYDFVGVDRADETISARFLSLNLNGFRSGTGLPRCRYTRNSF